MTAENVSPIIAKPCALALGRPLSCGHCARRRRARRCTQVSGEGLRCRERPGGAKSVLGAHPGVILVWQGDTLEDADDDIAAPEIHGSPVALADQNTMTRSQTIRRSRSSKGLPISSARWRGKGHRAAREPARAARTWPAFFTDAIGPSGRFLEADGCTAGTRRRLDQRSGLSRAWKRAGAWQAGRGAPDHCGRPDSLPRHAGQPPFPLGVSGVGRLQWANSLSGGRWQVAHHALDKHGLMARRPNSCARRLPKGATSTRSESAVGGERSMRILSFRVRRRRRDGV